MHEIRTGRKNKRGKRSDKKEGRILDIWSCANLLNSFSLIELIGNRLIT
jgi:hypothetical protein